MATKRALESNTPESNEATSAKRPRKASKFLSLPGELRNHIYDYVMQNYIKDISKRRWRDLKQWRKQALFHACRLLRTEGLSIFYDYLNLENYTFSTKEWKTLTSAEVANMVMLPWKYDLDQTEEGGITLEEAHWIAYETTRHDCCRATMRQIPDRYEGVCIQRVQSEEGSYNSAGEFVPGVDFYLFVHE